MKVKLNRSFSIFLSSHLFLQAVTWSEVIGLPESKIYQCPKVDVEQSSEQWNVHFVTGVDEFEWWRIFSCISFGDGSHIL